MREKELRTKQDEDTEMEREAAKQTRRCRDDSCRQGENAVKKMRQYGRRERRSLLEKSSRPEVYVSTLLSLSLTIKL